MRYRRWYVVALLAMAGVISAEELHVGDFGAVGDGVHDDGPALRAVFAAASKTGTPCTISFEGTKTYYIAPHDEANGRLLLREASNVTVQGHGAMLIVHPPNRALGVYRSRNVRLRDLRIDYRPVPYVQGTITNIDNESGLLEFEPHPRYLPPVEGDESLYKDGRNEDSITFNHETNKFYHAHCRVREVKALGNGRFRVSYRGHRFTEARLGDYFAMKNRWGPRTGLRNADARDLSRKNEYVTTADASISIVHSNNVVLDNIHSYASPGMTVNTRGCHDLVIRGLQIRRCNGRLVAGCSDGIHIKCNKSPPVIQDCHIEATMDDSIHIKISGDWITEVASPRRVRIRHMDIAWDNTNLGPGKRVMAYDHDRNRELATATIIEYEPIDHRHGWVTLDRDIPELSVNDSFYLEAEGEAIIERCQFGTQLQRAVLTHQPTVIRDCTIEDNGQGIVVGFGGAIEGPPSQRLRVERCRFTRLKRRAIYVQCPSKDYDQKGDPQFICTESVFRLPEGSPAFHVINSQGVALRNNRYYYAEHKPSLDEYLIFDNSPLREDHGNVFVESGVYPPVSLFDGCRSAILFRHSRGWESHIRSTPPAK